MREVLAQCVGSCISEDRVGRGLHRDSASFTCVNCWNMVCLMCGSVPVLAGFDLCDPCGKSVEAFADDWPEQDERTVREQVRQELTRIVASIVRASGQPFHLVNQVLNRKMNVRRRADATSRQLRAGVSAGRTWLRQIADDQSSDANGD